MDIHIHKRSVVNLITTTCETNVSSGTLIIKIVTSTVIMPHTKAQLCQALNDLYDC